MKKIIVLIIICLILSCSKDEKVNETYTDDGVLSKKEYYKNDKIYKIQTFYSSGKLKDDAFLNESGQIDYQNLYSNEGNLLATLIYKDNLYGIQKEYFKDQKIKTEGELYNGKHHGWWIFYDAAGKVIRKDEVFTIEEEKILNQRIVYDFNGKINYDESFTMDIIIKDTLEIGRSIGDVKLTNNKKEKPAFSQYDVYVGYDVEKDFSNLNRIKLDTFYSEDVKDIWFGVEFRESGNKTIGGFIDEIYYFPVSSDKNATEKVITRRYFLKNIHIKDEN